LLFLFNKEKSSMALVEPMERMSSFGSAASRLSVSQKVDGEAENHEFVSVAGDIGARTLQGGRKSTESGGFRLSIDHIIPENGSVYKQQEEYELQQLDSNYIVNPQEQFPTLVATSSKVHSEDIKQVGSFSNFLLFFLLISSWFNHAYILFFRFRSLTRSYQSY
jgi:hypothetical protein